MSVTIKDVAKESGYSVTTVSYALNDHAGIPSKTKEKIKDVAKKLNYVPSAYASSLKSKKSFNIGVFVADFDGPVHQTIISGIAKGINEVKGPYKIFVTVAKSSMNLIKSGIVDLAVIMDSRVSNAEVTEISKIVPVITFDMKVDGDNIYYTDITNKRSVYEVVMYLYKKGLTRIGYLLGAEKSYHNQMRFEGYKMALDALGLKLDKSIVFNGGKFIEEAGFEVINSYLKKGKIEFDALVCANDELAIGALKALSLNNVNCPKDVKVTGFDNDAIGQTIKPTLSTISVNWQEYGRKIARYAIDIISGEKVDKQMIIETTFIERDSTK